jgi:hypothetical protein
MPNALPREVALKRLHHVFRRRDGIRITDRFDVELTARPPGDFRLNEFDQLLEDAQQMKSGGVDMKRGVESVDDFCELAESFARINPPRWMALVRQWEKEERMTSAPAWRQNLWRLLGI